MASSLTWVQFLLWKAKAEGMGWENKVPQVRFRQSLRVISNSDCPFSTVSTSGGDSGKWPSLNIKLDPCHLHLFFQICFYLEQVIWYISICIVTVPRSLCPLLEKHDMEWKIKTMRCIDFFYNKKGEAVKVLGDFRPKKRILPQKQDESAQEGKCGRNDSDEECGLTTWGV